MTDNDMTPDEHLPATKADLRRVCDRLDGQDARFNSIDGRLSSHDDRFDAVDRRFDAVDGNLRRLNLFAARTDGRLASLEGKVDVLMTLKSDFARFQTGLDAMARQMESFERWCRSQGSMLMEHEARITKLESKPS